MHFSCLKMKTVSNQLISLASREANFSVIYSSVTAVSNQLISLASRESLVNLYWRKHHV